MKNDNNFKYDLSIGMIVKNEEANLDRCLSSMLPLKKLLNCEIIVTDTGSTDKTVEIAKKYADKVLYFEWCDDFAKARNYGVDKSEGRWFMFIDADEVFDDDISEIAKFIKSEISNQFNSATLKIEEYLDRKSQPLKFAGIKLCNMYPTKVYFDGKIHEQYKIAHHKLYHIQSTLHHFGYVNAVLGGKQERNAKLIKQELKKDPTNLTHINHLIDCQDNPYDMINMCKMGIDVAKNNNKMNNSLVPIIYFKLCQRFYLNDDIENLIESSKEFFKFFKEVTLPKLEVLSYIFLFHNENSGLNEKYKSYLDYQMDFAILRDNPDTIFSTLAAYRGDVPRLYLSLTISLVAELLDGNEIDKAVHILMLDTLENYKYSDGEFSFLPEYIELASRTRNVELSKRISKFYDNNSKNDKYSIIKDIDDAIKLMKSQEDRNFVFEALPNNMRDSYVNLNNIRRNGFDMSNSKINIDCIKEDENIYCMEAYSDLLYIVIRDKIDIFDLFGRCSITHLERIIYKISKEHNDFDKYIYEFILHTSKEGNKSRLLKKINCVLAYNYLLIKNRKIKNTEFTHIEIKELVEIFELMIGMTNDYVDCSYSKNLSRSDIISILPDYQAFFCSIYNEFKNKDNATIEYIRAIKENIKYCTSIADCINAVIKFTASMPIEDTKPNPEFEKMAKQFKQAINSLIRTGRKQQAIDGLTQYKQVSPTDRDIKMFEKRINAMK